MFIENSSNASSDIGSPPPGKFPEPFELIPKELLYSAPSIVKLFCLKFPPPICAPSPDVYDCGAERVRSLMLLLTVGILSICDLLMLVTAPVLLELKMGFRR